MKMTIVNKIYIGIGILAAVLVGLTIFSALNSMAVKNNLSEADKLRETQAQIAPRIVDHLKWAEGLAVGTMLFGREFKGQTDPAKCKFGEWYYAFKPPQEVEEKFKKIDEPHKRLHATAPKILAALKEGKPDLAKKIYQEETTPALAETQEYLLNLRSGFKEIVDGKTNALRANQDKMQKTSLFVYIAIMLLLVAGSIFFLARPIKKGFAACIGAAEKISEGDMNVNLQNAGKDEIGILTNAMGNIVEKLMWLTGDIKMLSEAAVEGRLDIRADAEKHQGDYRKMVEGINNTIGSLVGLIDSMPLPAMIIDKEFTVQYMNQTGAHLLNSSQKQLLGQKCYNLFKTSDCNTTRCACGRALREGVDATSETDAHPAGLDLEIQYMGRPMKDMSGNIIGAFEVVVDQTAIKKAAKVSRKIGAYQEIETQKLKEALGKMADGDLTFSLAVSEGDADIAEVRRSFEEIIAAVNQCVSTLRQLVGQTKEAADQVTSAADQIADASQNFSQKITEQAAAVEETSATIEEMSASIRQTAENSKEANKLAQNTKGIAESGSAVMGDTIKAMDEINRSSSKIANISNVIEEIAFQTNLLALNAAVEAARAGEHGKGFAVVASEIRNLAQRASQSAKEITGLIEDSVEKTGRGVQLAEELNRKLEEISTGIKKVTDLMDEVASAAQEQAAGTNQVNTAMAQIDQTTQQNASLVEETSSAAEELAAEAKELQNLVAFFRVNGKMAAEKRAMHRPAASRKILQSVSRERPCAPSHSLETAGVAASGRGDGHNGEFEEF